MLRAWDRRMSADSPAAALYAFWTAALQAPVRALLVPEGARDLITAIHPHVLIEALHHPDARFGATPEATRDALLLSALRSAIAALHTARGANVAGWAWGEVHALNLHHALDALLPAAPA